jgi:nucleotide sugar dehydrogenase
MMVCVVGLGKIGLPLAVQFASAGLTVTGCDIDADVVAAVNAGECPITGEAELAERLAAAVRDGHMQATTDTSAAVRSSKTVVIIVPVLLTADCQPDFSALDAATEAVAAGLQPGTLVILETTVPVGTTRNRLGAILAEKSGLQPGRDFYLAFSPERVSSGRIFADLRNYPKVIGGIDAESARRAEEFYTGALDAPVLPVRDAETAELVKLAETGYRDLNIAFANELAISADGLGLDVTEVIAAANSQPYSHIHQPGVGVGGHCLPVYPYFMLGRLPQTELSAAARRINDGMADYTVDKLAAFFGDLSGCSVLILGLAYRSNVKEAAYSSTLLLTAALERRGVEVLVHDPLFTSEEIARYGLTPSPLEPPPHVDAVIIQAFHNEYRDLDLGIFQPQVVLDGRNVLRPEEIEARGIRYLGIGR